MEKQIKIFSIPIYSCTRKQFENDYKKFIDNETKDIVVSSKDTGTLNEEEVKKNIIRHLDNMGVYEYNQIVGFLSIYAISKTIYIDLFIGKTGVHKFCRNGKKSSYVSLHQLSDTYFSVYEDSDVPKELLKHIKIAKKYIPKQYHLDLEEFLNIYNKIDYNKILK